VRGDEVGPGGRRLRVTFADTTWKEWAREIGSDVGLDEKNDRVGEGTRSVTIDI